MGRTFKNNVMFETIHTSLDTKSCMTQLWADSGWDGWRTFDDGDDFHDDDDDDDDGADDENGYLSFF